MILSEPDAPRLVYITCGERAEALGIARALVAERLAGSANVLGQSHSVYRWQGRIEEAEETVLIARTRAGRVEALIARVRALHRYACPCIVALPITEGYPDYLAWLVNETQDKNAGETT